MQELHCTCMLCIIAIFDTEMNNILPNFRWRRSKWGRYCPVELAQGNLVPGQMKFAVGLVINVFLYIQQ